MRIAFLILAHRQPRMLRRLIERLSSQSSYFFVHLDLKANLRNFLIETDNLPRVVYLSDSQRLNVNWGGFSIVLATLNLIKSAIGSDVGFSRFCLLSGNDYPIKPFKLIREEFESAAQFIQIQRRLILDGDSAFERRARRFFLGDSLLTNPKTAPSLLNRFTRKVESLVPRRFPKNVDLYYGSQWWSLTGDAISAILSAISERPELIGWFRWTTCADELFFQTLLKLTKFSSDIAYDFHATVAGPHTNFDSMHYIDWFTPNPTVPKVLDLSDWSDLRLSKALFARKFDEVTSSDLMHAIDQDMKS